MVTFLDVRSTPTGADVIIDSRKVGTTFLNDYRIEPGTYNIRIEKDGYVPYINLNYNILTTDLVKTLSITLEEIVPPEPPPEPEPEPPEPEEEIGEIWTITSPMGASVYLNNVYKGVTAVGGLLIPNLPPGSYVVKFTLEGYKDYLIDVIVKAWEQTQVSRTLVPIPPPEPEEEPEPSIWDIFLGILPKPVSDLIEFIQGLTEGNINEVLEKLLKEPDGESQIEALGMKAFDELVKEAPEYEVLRDAPKGSISIAVIIGIVTLILGIGTVIGWLRKEAPEPSGMAVWAAIEAEDWETANTANAQYREFIDKMNWWIPEVISWLNPFLAGFININADSQRAGADAYQKIIDDHLAIKIGTLIIRPTPSDAKVSVEGQYSTTGTWSGDLPIGPYSWTISKFGFVSKSGIIEVREGETVTLEGAEVTITEVVEEELPPEEVKGNLTISAIDSIGSAAGIIIEIAGQPDIVTPGTYELLTGSYSVRASKEGFISQTKTAYVNEAKDTVVSFILEGVEPPPDLPTKSTIFIESDPTNSDIYIDGKYTFTKTPYTTVLDAGTYIIRVQTAGYYPLEASVTFGEGDEITVPFILQIIPPEVEPTIIYDPYEPWYPDYVPPTYYTPAVQPTPYSQISLPDYSLIAAPTFTPVIEPVFPGVTEKEIMINIETTDVKPWLGKIFSIAWKDLTTPGAETQVIVDEDERGILEAFMNEFNVGNYKTIIGYNLKFDYQWIFNKLMLYRIPAKKFYETDMRDVYQLMSQIKEEFVYNARAYGTLDEYAKELLGIGKMGTQETLMRRYIAGDTDYVEAFQLRQIEITHGLYQLFRYCSSESFIQPISSSLLRAPGVETPLSPETPIQTGQKQCANCLAFNPITATQCEVCGGTIFK